MSGKRRGGTTRPAADLRARPAARPQPGRPKPGRVLGIPTSAFAAGLVAVVAIAVLAIGAFTFLGNNGSSGQWTVQGTGGHWTNVTADRLAEMLKTKDFTLVNVKTPYIGKIPQTDLYIPYDQLSARKAELPNDRAAKILVYCRSGAESKIAAQTLLDLGYTNVWNLDGGMNSWQQSGRSLAPEGT